MVLPLVIAFEKTFFFEGIADEFLFPVCEAGFRLHFLDGLIDPAVPAFIVCAVSPI